MGDLNPLTMQDQSSLSRLGNFSFDIEIPTKTKLLTELCLVPFRILLQLFVYVVRIWLFVVFILTPIHWALLHTKKAKIVKNVWVHPDEETTRLLNYITGKDSLTLKERMYFAQRMIDIEKKYTYTEHDSINNPHILLAEKQKMDYLLEKVIVRQFAFNEEHYHKIWKLEQESGSPKVRFVLEQRVRAHRPYWANYDFLENTLYINFFKYSVGEGKLTTMEEARYDDFLPEALHAKIHYEDPIGSALRISESALFVTIIWAKQKVIENKSNAWITVYGLEYDRHGTMEHQVHRRELPILRPEFLSLHKK